MLSRHVMTSWKIIPRRTWAQRHKEKKHKQKYHAPGSLEEKKVADYMKLREEVYARLRWESAGFFFTMMMIIDQSLYLYKMSAWSFSWPVNASFKKNARFEPVSPTSFLFTEDAHFDLWIRHGERYREQFQTCKKCKFWNRPGFSSLTYTTIEITIILHIFMHLAQQYYKNQRK